MAQKYTYQRHFEIDNSPDDYTHIVMEVAFRESPSGVSLLINALHTKAFYKIKRWRDISEFLNLLGGSNVEIWKQQYVSGFSLHVYPIKKSSPEYGTLLLDNTYYGYRCDRMLPIGETDENKAVKLGNTFINKDMWIFLAPAPRFQVTLMRQIESQLSDIINSQFGVVPNTKTRVLNSYDIDVSKYKEYISPN